MLSLAPLDAIDSLFFNKSVSTPFEPDLRRNDVSCQTPKNWFPAPPSPEVEKHSQNSSLCKDSPPLIVTVPSPFQESSIVSPNWRITRSVSNCQSSSSNSTPDRLFKNSLISTPSGTPSSTNDSSSWHDEDSILSENSHSVKKRKCSGVSDACSEVIIKPGTAVLTPEGIFFVFVLLINCHFSSNILLFTI